MVDDEKDENHPNVEINNDVEQEPAELFEKLVESRQDVVQVSEKVKNVSKGSRKYLITQIKELCEKQGLNSAEVFDSNLENVRQGEEAKRPQSVDKQFRYI